MARPAIPADLQRRVLVEAGHRCAIPTCKNPDVDVHHIIPWEKCNAHDFDNLIALCPNCHRRTHNGEIDRKSLLLYKAQLASAAGALSAGTVSPQGTSIEVRWSTHRVSEKAKAPNPYSVDLVFPQFFPNEGVLEEINLIQKAEAFKQLHECRSLSVCSAPPPEEPWAEMENITASSYEILLFESNFLSIKYTRYEYGAGAAHGRSVAISYNYLLRPVTQLHAVDLFSEPAEALKTLSHYCVSAIEREKQDNLLDEWVRKGAAPEWNNFACANLVRGGLIVTFQEYQVGPYSDGARTVYVPAHVIQKYANLNIGISELWSPNSKA